MTKDLKMPPKAISKEIREQQITNTLLHTRFLFVGWVGEFKNNKSEVTLACHIHGEWSTCFTNIMAGRRCDKCAKKSRIHTVFHVENEINKHLKSGQSLIGPVDSYSGNKSKFKIICDVHGEWSAAALHLIHSKSGCPSCSYEVNAKQLRKPKREVEVNILNNIKDSLYTFNGFSDKYLNNRSKVKLNCELHGEWITDVNTVVGMKHGCPSCSKNGYDSKRPATLYILRSECGAIFKAGISNNSKRRIIELKRHTPFDFNVVGLINSDGVAILELERAFHSHFESAQMKGFHGCTEWFKWNVEVSEWVTLLTHP